MQLLNQRMQLPKKQKYQAKSDINPINFESNVRNNIKNPLESKSDIVKDVAYVDESKAQGPIQAKLKEIAAPDLGPSSNKRSFTVSNGPTIKDVESHSDDRSAVVRAVVSVAGGSNNRSNLRRGTVTDIINE